MNPTAIQITSTIIFSIAILHTFSASFFQKLANRNTKHSGIFHLLGEIEIVFGFWALILCVCMFLINGYEYTIKYIDSRNFTEPIFVFCIMVISATKPILNFSIQIVKLLSIILPLPRKLALFFLCLSFIPILGSFITEPAAMTVAALLLRDKFFFNMSHKLKYATIATLFVNISIGGTLTSFAAPPILMVAKAWNWDSNFMLQNFGYKAIIAVCINAMLLTFIFKKEIQNINFPPISHNKIKIPFIIILIHLIFLTGIIFFSHHPAIFMGIFLFFLGIAHAYEEYQNKLLLKEGLLVSFFLAGLIVLGGQQQWWLQSLITKMSNDVVFLGSILLTAFTDNAAITYLASTINGLNAQFKYAIVAGALTGGGLTIIANAPNPAGFSILKDYFEGKSINALKLFLYSLCPTLIATLIFKFLFNNF